MASQPKETPGKKFDLINRGVKKSNPAGTGVFIGLRALDPVIQYGILAKGLGSGLLHKVGLETLPALPPNTGTFLDGLGLSPYRLILLAMATGTAVKQIFWLTATANEEFPPAAAVSVSLFNTFMNSLNTLAFTTVAVSASLSDRSQFPQTPLLVGSALYTVGIALETYSEIYRKSFKDDPKNEGKLCTTGPWGIVRHANYLGYVMWRAGFALASGGWALAAVVAATQSADFITRAIPVLDDYCTSKYPAQWEEYKTSTPYRLIPYVY
ncbi:hypothetical protein BT63DRAFT_410076 [Microthyrium microscopicum]|uniref:Steroid 5-alpha reductase C-terminal domain-containing protein n=1 Tax=Microthyrium microscopicum TaxID=703497 RepID=A0A6A6UMJ9_9PEZI|nr:hypothetical protein BT63DRAFT_410076 [Microthyrium microscopicum]